MTTSWKQEKMSSVVEIVNGGTPSTKDLTNFGTEIPWLAPKDLSDFSDRYIKNGQRSLSKKGLDSCNAKLVPKGTILLTSRAPIGYLAIAEQPISTNQGFKSLIPKPGYSNLFIYYLLKGNIDTLKQNASGTTFLELSTKQLEQISFSFPPLPTQRKIAAILSAYDDLIENNNRRIKILEEMAQLIYTEWFVNFRFPGHENVKMVESELGLIPEGWEVKKVKDQIKRLKAGRQYTQNDVLREGLIPVIDQSTNLLLGYHNNSPDHTASTNTPIAIFGDHTCKLQLMLKPFSVGPNVIPFTSKTSLSITWLYYAVNYLVETREYKRHWTELSNKEIIIPPLEVVTTFNELITPFIHLADVLREQNLSLQTTRDLLLPKLISRELDVEDLDIDVGEMPNE